MVRRKYILIFWIKLLIICMIISTIFLWFINTPKARIEDPSEIFMTTSPDWKSICIQYKDSVYNILDTEDYLCNVMDISKESLDLFTNDTLRVDSNIFCKLKTSIIIPLSYIDSLYRQKGMKAVLETYFDGQYPKHYNRNDTLSSEELLEIRYVIDILVRNGLVVFRDCESGIPMLLQDYH